MPSAFSRLGTGDRSITRFLLAAVGAGFLLLLAAGIAAYWMASKTREHSSWVAHTLAVQGALEHGQLLVEQGETARRGFLLARQPAYLKAYRGFEAQLGPAIDRISRLTRDNDRQQQALREYRRRLAALEAARAHTIALVGAGQADEAVRYFTAEAAFKRPRALRDQVARMLGEERRLLVERDAAERG